MREFLCRELQLNGVCRTAKYARYSASGVCSVRDVVLLQRVRDEICAGEVWFHADFNGEPCSLVSIWDLIRINRDEGVAVWQRRDAPWLVCTDDIIWACTYRSFDDGTVLTLLPSFL